MCSLRCLFPGVYRRSWFFRDKESSDCFTCVDALAVHDTVNIRVSSSRRLFLTDGLSHCSVPWTVEGMESIDYFSSIRNSSVLGMCDKKKMAVVKFSLDGYWTLRFCSNHCFEEISATSPVFLFNVVPYLCTEPTVHIHVWYCFPGEDCSSMWYVRWATWKETCCVEVWTDLVILGSCVQGYWLIFFVRDCVHGNHVYMNM